MISINDRIYCIDNKGVEEFVSLQGVYTLLEFDFRDKNLLYIIDDNNGNKHMLRSNRFVLYDSAIKQNRPGSSPEELRKGLAEQIQRINKVKNKGQEDSRIGTPRWARY